MPNTTEPLTEAQVDEIEARANAATKGPWTAYHRVSPRGAYRHWHVGNEDGLCQITMSGHERDYQFMAHARTDIPALIRDRRAMKAENERLQADLKQSRVDRDELSDTIEACHKMFDELDPDIEDGFTSLTPLEDRVREHLFPSDVITDDMVNGDD